MNTKTVDWLLQGDAWVEYRTRVDLLGRSEMDPQVVSARKSMLSDPRVRSLLDGLLEWPGQVLSSHKSASQPFHKLSFIADLGLNYGDPQVGEITARVMEHQSQQGPFQLPMNIPAHYGGSGENEWAWALCDAPNLVSALIKLGLQDDSRVQAALAHLEGLVRDNGWPCAVSPELGKFRGPGGKNDPCPYATLSMLKAMAGIPELHESSFARIGTETLLTLWEQSRARHPYMFFMGTDFRKLKAPLFWYDILHVLEVLSQFKDAVRDKRFREMLECVVSQADEEGRYTPGSVWAAWKDWDFGQKKIPSRGLTFYVQRILKRANSI